MAETKTALVSLEEMEFEGNIFNFKWTSLSQYLDDMIISTILFEEPIQPPASLRRRIAVKPMVLMGTGPTNPSKRVTEALIKPVMGIYTDEYNQVNRIHQYHTTIEQLNNLFDYSLICKLFA